MFRVNSSLCMSINRCKSIKDAVLSKKLNRTEVVQKELRVRSSKFLKNKEQVGHMTLGFEML